MNLRVLCFLLPAILVACASRVTTSDLGMEPPATTSPEPAPNTPLTSRIVYSSEGDVYVINEDGTGRTRLTDNPAEDFDPVWSPDGTQIAFRSHRDGNEEVYLMNADGTDQRNLSNAPRTDYSPAWSPDGQWIAFQSDRSGGHDLWVIKPDGSGLRQVTDIPGISEYPSWSPDSARIAFHCTFGRILSNGTGDFEICIVNADGTDLIQVTDTAGENKLPAWSPDGTRIAFESNRDGWPTMPDYTPLGYDPGEFGDSEIFIMNVDGSNQVNITNHPREGDSFPAWSRDGRLVFSRYGCLIIINADGSGLVHLGSCLEGGQFPDWYQPLQMTTATTTQARYCPIVFDVLCI